MAYSISRIDSMIRDLNNDISSSTNQMTIVNSGINLLNSCMELVDNLAEEINASFIVNNKAFRSEKLNLIRVAIASCLDNSGNINSSIERKVRSYRSEISDLQYQRRKLKEKEEKEKAEREGKS